MQDDASLDSALEAIERTVAEADPEGLYSLRLFVTGNTDKSKRAIANVKSICERYLAGRYELNVVDLYQQPELAKENGLIAAPTLVKTEPAPVRRIIGDMSNEDRVLAGLDLFREDDL